MLNQNPLLNIHRGRFLLLSAAAILAVGAIGLAWPPALWAYALVGPIVAVGLADMAQTRNSIRRNFPVLGNLRFLLSSFAPEIHQYFVESNTDGRPFDRNQRDIVDKRAEAAFQTHPFGTEQDLSRDGYEWVPHSMYPRPVADAPPRVRIGGAACTQPYEAAIFNISAMSFGALSAAAVRALNQGARLGGFFHDTGEGGVSPYHLEAGADLVWEIGSGYFGCRTPDGAFDPDAFARTARLPSVRMIEIKLSQGAKPGHGGVLPAAKNTPEIARIRGLVAGTKVVSPAFHSAFSDARGLLAFVGRLRTLSGGKPVGFKLCIGDRSEFVEVCRSMRETGILPDFITLDGSEGGTGAAPIEFSDSVGMPLEEALVFVTDTLRGYALKDEITLIAAARIITAFDIIRTVALGADICNSARGMMFALGCIQALKCDTNECPTGIATHDPNLTRGLVPDQKARRVASYQRETVRAALEILAAMGLDRFDQLERMHIQKRVALATFRSFEEIYPSVPLGALYRAAQ